MVLILKKSFDYLSNVNWSYRDETMQNMLFTGSPLPILLICTTYLLFVLKLGPAIMRNRPPYDLKVVLLFYNILQVVLNFYNGFYALYLTVVYKPYDYGCMMPISLDNYMGQVEKNFIHNYYLLKILDLSDTVFFVLRKNYKQVTFLHVYHHTTLLVCTYGIIRYFRCGGHMSPLGILNMIVHGFMYSYYFLSAIDKRFVWWKKYITLMQITQFIVLIGHNLWPLFMRPDCTFPKTVISFVLLQGFFMLYLFGQFYWRSYIRPVSKHHKQK